MNSKLDSINLLNSYVQSTGRSGQKLSVPRQQIANFPTTHKLLTQPPQGANSTSILSDASDTVNFLLRSGSVGLIREIFITISVTVASAAVQLSPTPYWVYYIIISRDAGLTQNQIMYPDVIHEYVVNMLQNDKFKSYAKLMNYTEAGQPNPSYQQIGTRTYVLPLPACYLNGLVDTYLKSDIQIQLQFQPAASAGTGSNLSVSNGGLQLNVLYDEILLGSPLANKYAGLYAGGVKQCFLQPLVQTVTQTFAPGTNYKIQTNSFTGKIAYLWYVLRASKTNTANAYLNYAKIGDTVAQGTCNILDDKQMPLYPSNIDVSVISGLIEPSNHYNNYNNVVNPGPVRHYLSDPKDFWERGVFNKYISMNQNYWVTFTTAAYTAETARVVTLTSLIGATAGAMVSGSWQLVYNCPNALFEGRKSFISAPILYSASTANVAAAIIAMQIPEISVAVSGNTFASSTYTFVLTITGINSDRLWHIAAQGAEWSVVSSMNSVTATTACFIGVVDTTASTPASGFPYTSATSLTCDIYALRISAVDIEKGMISNAYEV